MKTTIIGNSVGHYHEQRAINYLLDKGLLLVETNFTSRFGEIDIIMQDGDSLVFVEVKYRQAGIEQAIESITWSKQRKLIKTAQYYLLKVGYELNCRFDAVVLDDHQQIEWLKNIILL